MRPYGESFAVGGSNCHEFSHGGVEFWLPSCDADATLPPAYRTAACAGMEETGPRDQLQVTKRIN